MGLKGRLNQFMPFDLKIFDEFWDLGGGRTSPPKSRHGFTTVKLKISFTAHSICIM